MRVGWLCDDPGYVGGAELTQAEFKAAAPDGVQIIECPPGGVVPDLDAYAVHNCVHYSLADVRAMGDAPITKYVNDVWPATKDGTREWLLSHATLIFCSPLHQRKFLHEIPDWAVTKVIPPPVESKRFKPTRQSKRHDERKGTCSIAGWRNAGKGAGLVEQWAAEYGPVDVYGGGEFYPGGPHVNHCGELAPEQVAQTLWRYERFVFLPTEVEPFCRSVIEAYFAGCSVVTNNLVGAKHYIETSTAALNTAADDFWEVVLA